MVHTIQNPAVLDMAISSHQKGLVRRNSEALQYATLELAKSILKCDESVIELINCIPNYVVRALRESSSKSQDLLVRTLSNCLCLTEVDSVSSIDSMLAKDFVFFCYYSFYQNESRDSIESRINNSVRKGKSISIRFIVSEAGRVGLKSTCDKILNAAPINNAISSLFNFGARVNSVYSLYQLAGIDYNYDWVRRNWGLYNGNRCRGNIAQSLPEDKFNNFLSDLHEAYQSTGCIFEAVKIAYCNVEKCADTFYTVDQFVAKLSSFMKESDIECIEELWSHSYSANKAYLEPARRLAAS
ncbi:TPA: hypothetical protein ACPXMY_002991 [Vibrio metoecus]